LGEGLRRRRSGRHALPECEASGVHILPDLQSRDAVRRQDFSRSPPRGGCRMVRARSQSANRKKVVSGHVSDSDATAVFDLTTDDMREAFETTEKFREAEQAKKV